MARRRNLKSISTPIILGATSVLLSAALLVGWTLLIAQNLELDRDVAGNVWLLVLGAISFVVIISVLVLFSVFLAREILEVRKQDSFIDSVTHELKSPLASLKLCLETMSRSDVDGEQRDRLRVMMNEDVDRLSSFIDDVLQASRVVERRSGLNVSDVVMADFLQQCVGAAARRNGIAKEDIRIDSEADLTVRTDRAALEIVIKNLIDNALKYSGESPEVVLHARSEPPDHVRIEVSDKGIGIPPQHLKRVFHRFYRVQTESVRRRRGTGLGLFVVWSLVRNLGGKVRALSEGEGQGTTMRVTLPAQSAAAKRRSLK